MRKAVLLYSSAEARTKYGRVVELVDSLDSGSSVHCGRAGSSPASPTKIRLQIERFGVFFFTFGDEKFFGTGGKTASSNKRSNNNHKAIVNQKSSNQSIQGVCSDLSTTDNTMKINISCSGCLTVS